MQLGGRRRTGGTDCRRAVRPATTNYDTCGVQRRRVLLGGERGGERGGCRGTRRRLSGTPLGPSDSHWLIGVTVDAPLFRTCNKTNQLLKGISFAGAFIRGAFVDRNLFSNSFINAHFAEDVSFHTCKFGSWMCFPGCTYVLDIVPVLDCKWEDGCRSADARRKLRKYGLRC